MVPNAPLRMSPDQSATAGVTGGPVMVWTQVVLVGFMGSGKTVVGRRLARELDWGFVDLDDQVEAASGSTIAELFAERGEAAFRELEAQAGAAALKCKHVVLAPGGGWPLVPGRIERLPPSCLSVWLRVSAETAVQRVRSGRRVRPLLGGSDAVDKARVLLREREPAYAHARLHFDTEHASPAALALRIAKQMERGE